MPNITKFDNSTLLAIVKHYSEGMSISKIAGELGVHRNTIGNWIKKHDLWEQLKAAKIEFMASEIESNLRNAARGAKTIEVTEYYDDEGNLKSKIKREKIEAPDLRANQALSRRYAPEFSDAESNNNDKTKSIDINVNVMSQRELAELRKLNALDAEYKVVADIPSKIVDNSD